MRGIELSLPERQRLEFLLLCKQSLRAIGKDMGRDHSVLSRERRRNSDGKRYRAVKAQMLADARRPTPPKGSKLDHDSALGTWVESLIRKGWSPEKIAGRTRLGLAPGDATICHETVYQWLYLHGGRFGSLSSCLWTRRKRRWSRKGRRQKNAGIEGKIPVTLRPEDVRPGSMESDSMIWASAKGLLSAQVCRMTKICRLRWCPDRTAEETLQALRRTAETLPYGFLRDIAFDNGSENSLHAKMTEEYCVPTYFCAPHSPWQKPQIENLNRTIRHWLPRKTKVSSLSERDWKATEDRLNNLPRKSLRYLTPNEALNQYLTSGALVT